MMHGVTAAGKTQTSLALEARLGLIRLSTSQLKIELGMQARTQDYSLRDLIYEELCRRLEVGLKERKSFVLDGTFALRRWRQRVYRVCAGAEAALTVVACLCENRDEIFRRLTTRREKSVQSPDDEADGIEYWATEKQEIEEIFGDELGEGYSLQMIVVDTFHRRVLGHVLVRSGSPLRADIEDLLGFGS